MSDSEGSRVDEARRRLLRVGAYAVPAVLSVVVVKNAQAQQSCNPVTMGMSAFGMEMGHGMDMGLGMDMGNSDMG